jgi:hypothetical protein
MPPPGLAEETARRWPHGAHAEPAGRSRRRCHPRAGSAQRNLAAWSFRSRLLGAGAAAVHFTCCSPSRPPWTCFTWAGPASPALRPGTWRTWTPCSASSCTGQFCGGSEGAVPCPLGYGGRLSQGSRGETLIWGPRGTLAAGPVPPLSESAPTGWREDPPSK